MTSIQTSRRPYLIAAALGAALLTAGCAGTASQSPNTQAALPSHLDGGIGQLMRYCEKFRDSGDLATAAGMCERAHRMEPENPEPLMALGRILNEMDRPQQAVLAYQRILEFAPGHAEAHYGLGRTYVALAQYDLAIAELETARSRMPEKPKVYNALGVAYGMMDNHDSATAVFQAGLAVAPDDVPLRNNYGLSLVLAGRHDEGIAELESIAADPEATATSRRNLNLAYGIASAARTDAELSKMPAEIPEPVEPESLDAPAQTSQAPEMPEAPTAQMEDPVVLATPNRAEQRAALPVAQDAAPASSEPTPTSLETASRSAAEDEPIGEYLIEDKVATTVAEPSEQRAGMQSGSYAVQFASYRSEERAHEGWSELNRQAPELLGGITPSVQRADLGDRGTFYRLRSPGSTRDQADRLCGALGAQGIDCIVVTVDSETLAEAPSDTTRQVQ